MITETDEFFVLLVEDNPADVETVRRTADELSFEVRLQPIKNGHEAFEYLQDIAREPAGNPVPDLILLDLNLPGMRGQKILRGLRRNSFWENTPVVIFSGSNDEAEIHRCYDRGANAYIPKPRSLNETTRVLEELFSFYRNQ